MSSTAHPVSLEKKAIVLSYVQVIVDTVEKLGGNKSDLLNKAGIKEASLNQFFEFISLKQYETLLQEAINMTGEPGLGLHIGRAMKFGAHGTFAYAALSFPTAWDAMKVGRKFSRLCNRIVSIEMHEQQGFNVIRIESPYFSGALYRTVIEIVTGTFCEIFNLKFAQGIAAIEIDLRFGRPAYGEKYDQLWEPSVRFEQPANEIRIPTKLANTKLAMADTSVAERFERECDELIASMAEPRDITERVRQTLFIAKGGFPSLDDLAAQLHMSPRTLRRRLQERGTSFQKLLEGVRLEIAKRYLLDTQRSVGEIARMLGYEDQNSFSWSFKQLTGLPPTKYRKQHQ